MKLTVGDDGNPNAMAWAGVILSLKRLPVSW
jgi:hypothetical protein